MTPRHSGQPRQLRHSHPNPTRRAHHRPPATRWHNRPHHDRRRCRGTVPRTRATHPAHNGCDGSNNDSGNNPPAPQTAEYTPPNPPVATNDSATRWSRPSVNVIGKTAQSFACGFHTALSAALPISVAWRRWPLRVDIPTCSDRE
ncbi:hypothetical protein Acsp05_66780 [Actinokineospora sp. NBRC 105648]|nr:hypothetical protein Acsp05_66780 [Actinokineospora sp. NBRC 105648]